MESSFVYLLAADAILLLHVLFVVFVVVGLLLVLAGKVLSWSWVRNPWFRLMHLAAIGVVVLHWLEQILYYQAPAWVFIVCYSAFGLAALASWFLVRRRPFSEQERHEANSS